MSLPNYNVKTVALDTTGATVHNGAKALLAGGVGEVVVFTLAVGYQSARN